MLRQRHMALVCSFFLILGVSSAPTRNAAKSAITPVSIYGAWHCGDDFCTWTSARDLTEFDNKNHCMIDRGDGTPSVNLVVLSFVHPLRLLNKTNDAATSQGIPSGMTQAVLITSRLV